MEKKWHVLINEQEMMNLWGNFLYMYSLQVEGSRII